MYRLVFVCVLLCGVSGYSEFSGSKLNASVSETVHAVKEGFDIKRELDEIKRNKKKPGQKRPRRYSAFEAADSISDIITDSDATSIINKATAGMDAFFKTYVYQPIAFGNFQESTIRGYKMLDTDEGQFVFGTLSGELNQSFKSIMKNGNTRTGDIISCRIPTNRMAEHYMMVVGKNISEVGVVGGKSSHNGFINIGSYRNSTYINSTECLHHRNRAILTAEEIDDRNNEDKETDLKYLEILRRINCTLKGRRSGQFKYDVMTCNCQDLVLYWAYGYVANSNCLAAFFNGCTTFSTNTLHQIYHYVDESGDLQKKRDEEDWAVSKVDALDKKLSSSKFWLQVGNEGPLAILELLATNATK